MSHPLGPRFVRPAKRAKKITLKPPTDQYFINVSIPPHVAEEEEPGQQSSPASIALEQSSFGGGSRRGSIGGQSPVGSAFSFASHASHALRGEGHDYSSAAVNAVTVHLHVDDTVEVAIAKILARFRDTSANGSELARPASSYMLCRCFADYSVDFSQRALHGPSSIPLVQCLDFPYFLSLQIIPYIQHRDAVQFEEEPGARLALREMRRSFVLFALGYAEMLRKMHQQYRFLLGRDADQRRQKKQLEVQARHDVELRIGIAQERKGRQAIADEEARDWALTAFMAKALWAHTEALDAQWAYSSRELGAANRRLMASLSTEDRQRQLQARFELLVGTQLPRALATSLQAHRDAYTESRVACGVRYAGDVEADVDLMNARRVVIGKQRHPELYRGADVTNPLTINGDVYSSSRSLV